MPKIYFSKKFKKKYKKLRRSGNFNRGKCIYIINNLQEGISLDKKHNDHQLSGNLIKYRECHIENDLLLIYEVIKEEDRINILDIGSHSDLFS